MAEPGQAEAIARSQVPEGVTPATPLTSEQEVAAQRGAELRKAYQESLAKKEDAMASLMPIVERPSPDFNAEEQLKRRVGTEATPANPGTAEGARLDQAKGNAALAEKFDKEGFDALTDVQKDALTNQVINGVLDIRPMYRSLSPEEKKAIAQEILKNPVSQDQVRELLKGRLNPEEAVSDEGILEAKARFDTAEANLTGKRTEQTDKTTERATVRANLDEFEVRADGTQGDKLRVLETLEADEFDNQDRVAESRTELRDAMTSDDDMRLLEEEVRRKMGAGEAMTNSFEIEMQEVLQRENELRVLEELRTERANLTTRMGELETELAALPGEIARLQAERDLAENAFGNARNTKAAKEQELVRKLERIFAEAGNKVLDKDIKDRFEAQKKLAEEQLKEANDKDGGKVSRGLQSRYDRFEGPNNVHRVNKNRVNADWNEIILDPDGATPILRELLMEGLADSALDTPEVRANKQAERDRINQRLATDKDFVNKQCTTIAGRIIAKKMQSGRIYEGELIVLGERDWGGDAIDVAISQNTKLRDQMEKMYGKLGGKPNYFERIRREAGSNWPKLLLMLLAGMMASGPITQSLINKEGGRTL